MGKPVTGADFSPLWQICTLSIMLVLGGPAAASEAVCAEKEGALGTARIMEVPVSPGMGLHVGRKSFAQTLPLAPREVVLTFDDGPWPQTTPDILDALKAECVRATFFLIGQNAKARPALVKRMLAEGHTVAHHSMTHPAATLAGMSLPAAISEIERGIAADEQAAYGKSASSPQVPFFRFPGFASSPELLDWLDQKGIAVFGADLWASDWNMMTAEAQMNQVLQRLDAAGGGIILFHDTKKQTAAMIPAFLRALSEQGYRVVHIVPAGEGGG